MRVLSVSTHFTIGGISNYMLTLARALKRRGVTTIVATAGGDLVGELEKSGIAHRFVAIDTKFELHPKVFRAALTLAKIVRDEAIEVIHAHSRVSQVAALLASRITGVPVVTTCHGYFTVRARRIIDTWGARVIAISEAVKEHLIRDLGVRPERIALVYSGVDVDRFAAAMLPDDVRAIRISLGLKDGPVVGTIGRLSPVKGHAYLIEALKRAAVRRPAVQGLIVGDGGEKDSLRSRARQAGIRDAVTFVSSHVDTRRFLAAMDVFVFPSVAEGLGIALLEALASGRACVASRVGGIGDIITDGVNGLLVPVGDPESIANAILALLDDPARAKAMGDEGRRLVRERFSLERMAADVHEVYARVVGGPA